jgi:hypothetical protein
MFYNEISPRNPTLHQVICVNLAILGGLHLVFPSVSKFCQLSLPQFSSAACSLWYDEVGLWRFSESVWSCFKDSSDYIRYIWLRLGNKSNILKHVSFKGDHHPIITGEAFTTSRWFLSWPESTQRFVETPNVFASCQWATRGNHMKSSCNLQ